MDQGWPRATLEQGGGLRATPRGGRRKADVVLTEVAKIDEKNHEMTDFKKFAKKLSSEC
jgi:hypothetical protein